MPLLSLWRCITGPRLYRIHRTAVGQAHDYAARDLEAYSDTVVKWINFFNGVITYTSPILLTWLYRRGSLSNIEGLTWLTKIGCVVLVSYYVAIALRGVGRFTNQEYLTFLSVLESSHKNWTPANWLLLSSYDFEFSSWPVDFKYDRSLDDKREVDVGLPESSRQGILGSITSLPYSILSYLAIHSFGKRMVYPGATAMQYLLTAPLNQGRAKLVEEKRGRRAKLVAGDGNEIDTMFVDRRNSAVYPHGNTLVICFEGNAGFYEIGVCVTPLDAGYSVLGWNHPGFAGSTGFPFPENERNAIDVVMQYATRKLGFEKPDIVLFAWSIGGYSATYAGAAHPDIRSMILDATFDDITPMALKSMPGIANGMVKVAIKTYMPLYIAQQLTRYPGPVLLIRRTKDEIITTGVQGVVADNRGNFLLIHLLQYRYPNLLTERSMVVLKQYLAGSKFEQLGVLSEAGVEEDLCLSILKSYVTENSYSYPMHIGTDIGEPEKAALLLYLASKYMVDFDSTHCNPLPAQEFRTPWNLTTDQ